MQTKRFKLRLRLLSLTLTLLPGLTGPALAANEPPERLHDLMVDILSFKTCEALQDKIISLSENASGEENGGREQGAQERKPPTTGNLWVRNCSIRQTGPETLRVEFSGTGWQWIARTQRKLGAQFEVDENVHFTVRIGADGSFKMAYDPASRIFTGWFMPEEPMDVTFEVRDAVEVRTPGLWSSAVGQAAEVLTTSPQMQAERTIREKGANGFRKKLGRGVTLALNLCTGQREVEFGILPAGQMPPGSEADSPNIHFLAKEHAVLYKEGFLMDGPFEPEKPAAVSLSIQEGGGVRAWMACKEDAQKLVDAAAVGTHAPPVPVLHGQTARPERSASFEKGNDSPCTTVLILEPLEPEQTPVTFDYAVFREGQSSDPLAACPEPAATP